MNVTEKREMERFALNLPALLSIKDDRGNRRAFEFMIRDICAGGAFFKTDNPLSVGTHVKMDLILPLAKFNQTGNKRSHVNISGSVIRTESQGMAVCFDKKYSISLWNRQVGS
jgi:hypothetical protein